MQCGTQSPKDVDNVERVNQRAARFVSSDQRTEQRVSDAGEAAVADC